jgi:rhodanese-related sulfurtransferase
MIEQLSPKDLAPWAQEQLSLGRKPVVVDVREDWEIKLASIKAEGFELKHIVMNEIPGALDQVTETQAIAVLCHHGGRSQNVAHFLLSNGVKHVSNISGGINAWSHEVDPSVPVY